MNFRLIVQLIVAGFTLVTLTGTPALAGPREALPHKIYGVIRSIAPDGKSLQLEKRNRIVVTVDISEAQANRTTGALPLNGGVAIFGVPNANGTFHAIFFGHASENPNHWGADD